MDRPRCGAGLTAGHPVELGLVFILAIVWLVRPLGEAGVSKHNLAHQYTFAMSAIIDLMFALWSIVTLDTGSSKKSFVLGNKRNPSLLDSMMRAGSLD